MRGKEGSVITWQDQHYVSTPIRGGRGVRMARGAERVEKYRDPESRVESHTSEGITQVLVG